MVSSRWGVALSALLAGAGLVWGQQPAGPGAGSRGTEKIVGVRELDGPEQKGRLLQLWTTAGGQKACLVELLSTREMLTVVENGGRTTGPDGKALGAQIYHWGNSKTPPMGSPTPPGWSDRSLSQVAATKSPGVNPLDVPPIPLIPSPAPVKQTSAVMPASATTIPSVDVPVPMGLASPIPCPTGTCAPGTCASGACGKEPCPSYIYRYERVPHIWFKQGNCVPVCPPYHAPDYGYYQTQWRSWNGGAPVIQVIPSPPSPPSSSAPALEPLPTPMLQPARYR